MKKLISIVLISGAVLTACNGFLFFGRQDITKDLSKEAETFETLNTAIVLLSNALGSASLIYFAMNILEDNS